MRDTRRDKVTYSSEPFGVPLAEAELAEMFRRARIQSAMDDAIAHARTLDGFAGAYLDQKQGGRPVFMFTAPDAARRSALAARLPEGADVQVKEAVRTESELAELKGRVEADVEDWTTTGIEIVRVAIRTSLNTLRIGVLAERRRRGHPQKEVWRGHRRLRDEGCPHRCVCRRRQQLSADEGRSGDKPHGWASRRMHLRLRRQENRHRRAGDLDGRTLHSGAWWIPTMPGDTTTSHLGEPFTRPGSPPALEMLTLDSSISFPPRDPRRLRRIGSATARM